MCYTRTEYYYYSIVLKGVVHTASLTFLEGSLPTKFLSTVTNGLWMAWPMPFDPKGVGKDHDTCC